MSADGSVVELVVWTGALAREGVRRAALVIRGDEAHEMTAGADAEDAAVRDLGAFVHEPDGAVIRARLIGDVARSLDAGMLDPQIAYLTGETVPAGDRGFRIVDQVTVNERALRSALAAHDCGSVEILVRGLDVDPDRLRKKLKLKGSTPMALVLTRIGRHGVAFVCEPGVRAD